MALTAGWLRWVAVVAPDAPAREPTFTQDEKGRDNRTVRNHEDCDRRPPRRQIFVRLLLQPTSVNHVPA